MALQTSSTRHGKKKKDQFLNAKFCNSYLRIAHVYRPKPIRKPSLHFWNCWLQMCVRAFFIYVCAHKPHIYIDQDKSFSSPQELAKKTCLGQIEGFVISVRIQSICRKTFWTKLVKFLLAKFVMHWMHRMNIQNFLPTIPWALWLAELHLLSKLSY